MSKAVKDKTVYIYEDGKLTESVQPVPVEMPAQFIINDRELLKVMVTPVQLREFAIGFLAGQGLIESLEDIKTEVIGEKKAVLYFELKGKEIVREDLMTTAFLNPGCGGGVSFKSLDLPVVETKIKYKMADLTVLMKETLKTMENHKTAGGFHCAALAYEGKLFYVAEDIGRHNAVDKVIGAALIDKRDFSKTVLFSTGRITVEAVAKASRMRIPIMCSCSAVTNLAYSLAQRQGITLIGYMRSEKAKVYTGVERLKIAT